MYGYIYKTTNLINGKIYIGQHKASVFDSSYYGSGKLIHIALKKHGKNNFKVEPLEWAETESKLSELEIFYIKLFNSARSSQGYNMSDGGQVPRLSGSNNGNYGHKWILEQRANLSFKKRKENLKPETRRLMSLKRKGKYLSGDNNKARRVVQLTLDGTFIRDYPTLRDAAKNLVLESKVKDWKLAEGNICAVCGKRQLTSCGYKWMYYSEYITKIKGGE